MKNVSEVTKIARANLLGKGINTTENSVRDVFFSVIEKISGEEKNKVIIHQVSSTEVVIEINDKKINYEDVDNAIISLYEEYQITTKKFFEASFKEFLKVIVTDFDDGQQFTFRGEPIIELSK